MRAYAKQRGSGANVRSQREAMLKAARRRELDIIMVWRLGRWGRSLLDLIGTLHELNELGVGFVSLSEALDLTTASGRLSRHARGLCRVRARHSARPRQGGDRASTSRGAASWTTGNRPASRR